jgi:antitoxin ParD1/3/4
MSMSAPEDFAFIAHTLLSLAAQEQPMNISIGGRWEGFVEEIVKSGPYGSAGEVAREGLYLVEEKYNDRARRAQFGRRRRAVAFGDRRGVTEGRLLCALARLIRAPRKSMGCAGANPPYKSSLLRVRLPSRKPGECRCR